MNEKLQIELGVCVLVMALSLTVAAVFHNFFPGFGVIFKPLIWPLLVLPFAVRPRLAVATAFLVPLASCAITGMPTLPMALVLASVSATVVFAVGRFRFVRITRK